MSTHEWLGIWCTLCVCVLCVVLCYAVPWCVLGIVLSAVFESFAGDTEDLRLTWNGKRAFVCSRFFVFLPVSSHFFPSLLASTRFCEPSGWAGRAQTHTKTTHTNNNHSDSSGSSMTTISGMNHDDDQ